MTDRVSNEIRSALLEVCTRFDTTLDAFETDGDHAHLLITYPPKVALSRLVMSMKTLSAMRVRAKNWLEVEDALSGNHFWSPSYAVVSCGEAPLETVKKYIENQKLPRRKPGRPRKDEVV
jgi:putative transposase